MSRFSGRDWLQNRPLAFQLWTVLSLCTLLSTGAGLLYARFFLAPGGPALDPERRWGLLSLVLLLLIANLFAAKLAAQRVTEPLEKLAENLARIRGKNWEEKIVQVHRKDEIGQLINTLSQIQRNVVEINEEEELFYQTVSHGLKTPIMVIQNCCAAYHDGIYGDEALDIIMKESLTLEKSVRKLLYVSSFDYMLGQHSDFCPVRLTELCQACRTRFVGNERGIRITTGVPEELVVLGNAAALQTVFDNIVENALRYAVSYVHIRAQEDPSGCLITFENDGRQIPRKVMDLLFEKFYKGADGNFGLGLYIAKKIVLFHKGEIWAENHPQGVRFRVLLKPAPAQPRGG